MDRRSLSGFLLLVATLFSTSPFSSHSLAAGIAMNEFGVCIKPQNATDPNAYCDQLIASGVKWVRMGGEWTAIEKTADGVYDTAYLAKLDSAVNRLHAGGVNIVWILLGTPQWASSQPSLPWPDYARCKPANWSDWEDFVTFIASRYNGKISHWEVWNEPDHIGFWKNSVADYKTLLQKAHARLKQVNPANTVLLGGLAMTNGTADSYGLGTFFDNVMAAGAGPFFDVTNYHAYGTYARHVKLHQGMTDVINKYALQGRPMWITETGYSTAGNTALEPMKADMVDQIHLGNLRWNDVDRTFWYCHSNPVLTPANPTEENFGLTTSSQSPLKAFRHYQALDGAETNFAAQATYPSLTDNLHTLYYFPATVGDGSYVTASGNDRVIATNTYMYLRVNDAWIYDANSGVDSTVDLDITYLDSGTGNFYVHYDAIPAAYQSIAKARTATGTWKTATFTLTNVKFANRQNDSADLRLASGGSALTVRKITLRKRYNPASVALRATPVFKLIKYETASSGEGQNAIANIGGFECRSIEGNSKFLYFDVSDGLIRSGDTNVSISITFWDAGTDKLTLHYNAIGNAHKGIHIFKTNTSAWRTVTLTVTDAHFINAQSYNSDFRISNGGDGTTDYVRKVEVQVNN